ncbi:MAG: endolytic transglycosylase MltG [Steroidobacteraceae bacterium]
MRSLIKTLLVTLLLLLSLTTAASIYAWRWLQQPVTTAPGGMFEVMRGASVSSIAKQLQQAGWVKHPQIWSLWARYQRLGNKIKAGEYALTPGLSPDKLLQLLSSGNVILRSLTIVEGSTYADLRRALQQRQDIRHTIDQLSDAEVMQLLGLSGVHPEAQFFPDTYQFAKGINDLDILRMAQQRMQRELTTAWSARATDLTLASAYEALILASIIEKETALPSERPLIAGVFVERLARGMRLQTDPTVIYGLGKNYDGNVHKADLLRDTPYNTYTRNGLPPTPICLPGAAALRAAVNPQRTGAIYFVATGKGDGSHYFSRALNEHNAAVQRYLNQLRAQ